MKTAAQINNGVCTNILVFDDSASTELYNEFQAVELPDNFGIGDMFDGENWIKAYSPVTEPSLEEKVAEQAKTIAQQAEIIAQQQEQLTMLTECMLEVSEYVYQ